MGNRKIIAKKRLTYIIMVFRLINLFFSGLRKYKPIIVWRITGKKIEAISSDVQQKTSDENYHRLITLPWEEIKIQFPEYYRRINFTISKCKGRVLEIGSGIGSMTKWISKSDEVNEIMAIDKSREAIRELKRYDFPKVTALQMPLEDIRLNSESKFDTVLICEVIEHIYPDEEIKMLAAVKQFIFPGAAFVVSTPIGWLDHPDHIRGFSKKRFSKHINKYYGRTLEIDYSSGYSQVAFGYFDIRPN